MNAATGKELTSFYVKIPDYHLALAMDLLADIINNSLFDEVEIGKEKSVVLQEIQLLDDSPDEYIHEFFDASFWRSHPLGSPILGTKQCVEQLTREGLLDFFHANYRGEAVVVAAAGNVRHEELVDMVGKLFGSLARNVIFSDGGSVPVVTSTVAVLPKELEQIHMVIGTLGPSAVSPERFPGLVLNAVLGGSMSSRLFQEVREKRGLVYTIHSFLAPYRDTGMIGIYAGTSEEKVGEVLAVTQDIIAGLCDTDLTEMEVLSARELIKGNFLLSMESTDNRMTRLARNEICLGRYVSEEDVVARIEEVTAESVREIARGCFQPATMSLAAVGRISREELSKAWRFS
jgi:predicted Zn-dependent peptidase